MPELAARVGEGGRRAPATAAASPAGHAVAWWLGCAGQSPFGLEGTNVVTTAEPPRAPCDMTGPAVAVFPALYEPAAAHLLAGQATQILQTFPDAPPEEILAGALFANVSRALLNRPRHDWPHALMTMAAPMPTRPLEAPRPPATSVLRELMRSTGGSAELVAETLGASRRSVYNWLKGKPVRPEFALRAERLHSVLAPLRDEWHPDALSGWLQTGDPSPAEIAAQERWADLGEKVRTVLRPMQPQPGADQASSVPGPEPWPARALLSVLSEFNSPPPTPARKTTWHPRELTGSTPEPDEE
jgi:hypothetical protein